MRLWLNRTAEVSLREQLITQVTLGILCKDLKAGERLPSTRELARRFGIHANTASAAYRELEREGWLEFRHGSGVYVRASRPGAALSPEMAVDQLIGELAAKARKLGASQELVRERLRRWLAVAPPARWLVIEPDNELRRIVMHEMSQALALPVEGCAPEDCGAPGVIDGALATVLPSKASAVRRLLPAGTELTVLEVHPIAYELLAHLQRYLPAHAGELVGIASRWQEFQRIARTMLIAAGISPESLLVRDATRAGWRRGLEATAGVVCDAITAIELPKGVHALRFSLLDEPTLATLRSQEQQVAAVSCSLTDG
jgi:DNA-binding transcriptional regulator YhcF (GntR family)